ncbi:serine/threonine-protein kinase [Nonomuraea coxensis]|nr:serine/threonine-protein kinase [Nonomuraea coxensis]
MVGGRYRLVAVLGSGGFGRVWRAHDEVLDVDVAIKELCLVPGMPQAEQDKRLERTAREARNAVRLRSHENVVAIHDIVTDGLPWIVMELVDGPSLHEHLETRGPLPVDTAEQVAAALLKALGAAHRNGIVHRDIKPANVMLDGDGRALLTDFGIALHTTDSTLTTAGMLIGSPEYMAPERLRGIDGLPAGDLFSLGVTLYQAVEGLSPFRRGTQPAALTAVLFEEPPPPLRAGRLAPLITRLLDKDPGSRPTAEQALAMLGERRPGPGPVRAATRVLPSGETPPKVWQHKAVAVMLGIIFALGLIGCTDAGVAWDKLDNEMDLDDMGIPIMTAVLVNVGVVGLLCAQVARFVPRVAGRTVAVIAGLAGCLAGVVAAALAVDGVGVIGSSFGSRSDAALAAPFVVAALTLIAGGWAWEARKARRPAPQPAARP